MEGKWRLFDFRTIQDPWRRASHIISNDRVRCVNTPNLEHWPVGHAEKCRLNADGDDARPGRGFLNVDICCIYPSQNAPRVQLHAADSSPQVAFIEC